MARNKSHRNKSRRNRSRRGGANQVVGMPAPKPSWSALFKKSPKNVPLVGVPPAPVLQRQNANPLGGRRRKTHRKKAHRNKSNRR